MQLTSFLLPVLTLTATLAPGALAGGCGGCCVGCSCGSVTNNSGKQMRYTTNPDPNLNARPGRCRFWNWYSANNVISLVPHDKTVSCTQQTLASGAGKKGGCSQKIDVDGFTFANDAYWIGARRVGAGVWTKIPDIVDVTCRRVPVVGSILCTLV